ncbi:hypothetical protein [Aliikangiella sp. G2MR2-5]|uniref:hypothetical protein n=1 Tax=Aliikangiella sp. G2MR2-5 TaxID=2788943 RepID=UPI0018AC6AD0|nr:hypothetical protein [Aliikangiella sp. G2MR2-5]
MVASLEGQQCRFQFFKYTDKGLIRQFAESFLFTDIPTLCEQFTNTCRKISCKGALCKWVLFSDHYQSISVDAPKVEDNEMAEALKWQVKDLLERPVEKSLVSFYRPNHPDQQFNQITAIAVEKELIEALIRASNTEDLILESIEIEELAIGNALLPQIGIDKLIGFVGENSSGLLYAFYHGGELCFCRHKKGKFIPEKQPVEEELLLEEDVVQQNSHSENSLQSEQREQEEEIFLLETQRTLDYVISQIYRRPLDRILLIDKPGSASLAETLSQLTETQVELVTMKSDYTQNGSFPPTVAEVGLLTDLPG